MKASVMVPVGLVLALAIGVPQITLAQEVAIAQVIEVRGAVFVKREKQKTYVPMRVGEDLFRGDLVRVSRGARGVIRCTSDSTTWILPADNVPRGVANTCS